MKVRERSSATIRSAAIVPCSPPSGRLSISAA
jgi:hypothetical protein